MTIPPLDELKQLGAAASPAPWDAVQVFGRPDRAVVVLREPKFKDVFSNGTPLRPSPTASEADADFIAAARNHWDEMVRLIGLVHDLETNCDPTGVVQEVAARRENQACLESEVERLRAAIRKHRDYRGDDRCYLDDEELYRILPEGFTTPLRDTSVELKNCERFIACRHNPGTVYVSPQREIERLHNVIRDSREVEWLRHGKRDADERLWESLQQQTAREQDNRERKIDWDAKTERIISAT
jgi:hypothetical protein